MTKETVKKATDYTIMKAVTVPSISFKKLEKLAFKALEVMRQSNSARKNIDGSEQKPATLLRIINLDTGEMFNLIVPQLLESALRENYPDEGYVNRCFLACKREVPGKRYLAYDVSEIEDPLTT